MRVGMRVGLMIISSCLVVATASVDVKHGRLALLQEVCGVASSFAARLQVQKANHEPYTTISAFGFERCKPPRRPVLTGKFM